MEKKPILKIDMDGVTADFAGAIKALEPNKTLLPNQNSSWVYDVCMANPRIFRTLKPIHGAIETIERLKEHYEIYFLTTPMSKVPESFTDKFLWLDEHFGEWIHERMILSHRKDMRLTPDKNLNVPHYLIDDRIVNGVENFTGIHIHYGTGNYPDWKAVEKFLMEAIVLSKNKIR